MSRSVKDPGSCLHSFNHFTNLELIKIFFLTDGHCWVPLHFCLHLHQQFICQYSPSIWLMPLAVMFRGGDIPQSKCHWRSWVIWIRQTTCHCGTSLAAISLHLWASKPRCRPVPIHVMLMKLKIFMMSEQDTKLVGISWKKYNLHWRSLHCEFWITHHFWGKRRQYSQDLLPWPQSLPPLIPHPQYHSGHTLSGV